MDTQSSIRNYCEDLCMDIRKRLEKTDDESEGKVLLSVYLDKCNRLISALEKEKGAEASDTKTLTILKEIAQLVLDVTYVDEVQLIEEEFPLETAESRIKHVLDSLTRLESWSSSINPGKDANHCLGPEIIECIRWRKGALLYMFCHTIQSHDPESKFPKQHVHYLGDGIEYLVEMLKTRSSPQWLESTGDPSPLADSQRDNDTLKLIEQGIFSDTHLLALMYCGELCYWYSCACCHTKGNKSSTHPSPDEKEFLSKNQSHSGTNETEINKDQMSAQLPVQSLECHRHGELDSPKCMTDSQKVPHNRYAADSPNAAQSPAAVIDSKGDEDMDRHFKFVSIGNSCLRKYINITNGSLVGAGWSSSRAEEILLHFKKLKI